MIATIVANFIFGSLVDQRRHSRLFCKISLVLAIAFNLSLLIFFKYFDFLAETLPIVEPIGLALPIGISFYTFQALSYVIDVYNPNDVLCALMLVLAIDAEKCSRD